MAAAIVAGPPSGPRRAGRPRRGQGGGSNLRRELARASARMEDRGRRTQRLVAPTGLRCAGASPLPRSGGTMSGRRYKRAAPGERFLLMPEWILVHERWRALSADARVILIDVCVRWNGPTMAKLERINNNGRIGYGCRSAARTGIKKDAAAHAVTELIEAGFLRLTGNSGFGADGKRHASEFRVTFFPTHRHLPTWRNPTSNTRRILIENRLVRSAAYVSLASAGKAVLIEMMRRENGRNNGLIRYGSEDGRQIGLSLQVTKRAINQVEDRGLIVMTARATKRRGSRRKWRLTMSKADGKAATMDFLKWRPTVSLVNLEPADGLAGEPQRTSARSGAKRSETTIDDQKDQGLQEHVTNSPARNTPSNGGEVWVHQRDTYRIPGVRSAPAVSSIVLSEARRAPVARRSRVKTKAASAELRHGGCKSRPAFRCPQRQTLSEKEILRDAQKFWPIRENVLGQNVRPVATRSVRRSRSRRPLSRVLPEDPQGRRLADV